MSKTRRNTDKRRVLIKRLADLASGAAGYPVDPQEVREQGLHMCMNLEALERLIYAAVGAFLPNLCHRDFVYVNIFNVGQWETFEDAADLILDEIEYQRRRQQKQDKQGA